MDKLTCPRTWADSAMSPVQFFGPSDKSASCFAFGRRRPPPGIVAFVTFSPVATVFFILRESANDGPFSFLDDAVPFSTVMHPTGTYSLIPGRPRNFYIFVLIQGVVQEVLHALSFAASSSVSFFFVFSDGNVTVW